MMAPLYEVRVRPEAATPELFIVAPYASAVNEPIEPCARVVGVAAVTSAETGCTCLCGCKLHATIAAVAGISLTIPPAIRNTAASRSMKKMNRPARGPMIAAMRPRRESRHPSAPAKVANIVVPGTLLRYCHSTAQMERARTIVVQMSSRVRTRNVPNLPMLE